MPGRIVIDARRRQKGIDVGADVRRVNVERRRGIRTRRLGGLLDEGHKTAVRAGHRHAGTRQHGLILFEHQRDDRRGNGAVSLQHGSQICIIDRVRRAHEHTLRRIDVLQAEG